MLELGIAVVAHHVSCGTLFVGRAVQQEVEVGQSEWIKADISWQPCCTDLRLLEDASIIRRGRYGWLGCTDAKQVDGSDGWQQVQHGHHMCFFFSDATL